MNKIFWVAYREFCATALTKGFIIGFLMTPLLILIVLGAVVYLKGMGSPRIVGTVAVIDRSGQVGELLKERFSETGMAAAAREKSEEIKQELKDRTSEIGLDENSTSMAMGQVDAAVAEVEEFAGRDL